MKWALAFAASLSLSASVFTPAVAQAKPAKASAFKKDAPALKLYDQAMDDDYLNVDLDAAEKKLKSALKLCGKSECSNEVVGKIHMGLATVHGLGQQKLDVAKIDFERALKADPNVSTIEGFSSPKFDAAFKKAKKAAKKAGPAAPEPPPVEEPEEPAPKPEPEKPAPKPVDSEKPSEHDGAKKDDGPPLTKTIAIETSGYIDNAATEVLSPSVKFGIENEVAGWGISGSFLLDVVTSASADIVATASPKWTDKRYAPSLDGHFKVDDATLSMGGSVSVESDYIAANGSFGVSTDFKQKTITPALSYGFGYDRAGRKGTPYSIYHRDLHSHTFQTSTTFVLDKATIFVPAFTASLEFGDSAKPYRYVPTFRPGTVLQPGEPLSEVNRLRTNVVLEERVPQTRQRYALAGLIAHRFADVTMRLDERVYIDSWGLKASTTDFMLPIDAASIFRIWPHVRFHAQTGVGFWKLAYETKQSATGIVSSGLRAGDRELGPLLGATFGGGFRIGGDSVGFTVTADAIYTKFLEQLYITERIAGFGTATLEAKF